MNMNKKLWSALAAILTTGMLATGALMPGAPSGGDGLFDSGAKKFDAIREQLDGPNIKQKIESMKRLIEVRCAADRKSTRLNSSH